MSQVPVRKPGSDRTYIMYTYMYLLCNALIDAISAVCLGRETRVRTHLAVYVAILRGGCFCSETSVGRYMVGQAYIFRKRPARRLKYLLRRCVFFPKVTTTETPQQSHTIRLALQKHARLHTEPSLGREKIAYGCIL